MENFVKGTYDVRTCSSDNRSVLESYFRSFQSSRTVPKEKIDIKKATATRQS